MKNMWLWRWKPPDEYQNAAQFLGEIIFVESLRILDAQNRNACHQPSAWKKNIDILYII